MSESWCSALKSLFSRILAASYILPAFWLKVDGNEPYSLSKFLGLHYKEQFIPMIISTGIGRCTASKELIHNWSRAANSGQYS